MVCFCFVDCIGKFFMFCGDFFWCGGCFVEFFFVFGFMIG